MPIIIDANRAGDFTAPLLGHAEEILRRLKNRSIRIVSGGKLHRELSRTRFREILIELQRVGRLVRVDDHLVDADEQVVISAGTRSDDPHVIALMRMSGCRLIYTDDNALIEDIGDAKLVSPIGCALKSTTSVWHVRYHLGSSGT